MTQICKRCRRVNPREASYCYHDGHMLGGSAGETIALDVSARPFGSPFFMLSGRACKNFNELALACRQDAAGAVELLRKGYLELFLAGQGRTDLAGFARAAAKAPDSERALDEFLGQLPGTALPPARLHVEPAKIDLGTLQPGEERRFDLTLINEGMRLLFGSASCDDCRWLTLGDATAQRRKVFQFSDRLVVPVHVLGRQVSAFAKAQEAEIRLESSGGMANVVVRMFVPVRPFPEGVLAGSMSPRQMAEKARESPKEAVSLIESGALERWYQANGWTYPVTGPRATGLAAVQQLFEALGLARPPRVELGEDAIGLSGAPGEKVEYVLAAVTEQNRAVAAFGTSDQPWLQVGPPVCRGRSALLPLTIPSVPGRVGETLRANVNITANGGQRFDVTVLLAVVAKAAGSRPEKPAAALVHPPPPPTARAPTAEVPTASVPQEAQARGCMLWTLLPAVLLIAALVGVVARDYFGSPPSPPSEVPDPVPRIEVRFHDVKKDDELEQLWLAGPEPTMRFGLVELHEGKEVGSGVDIRRLTFDPCGRTNNTCVRFDGSDERLFGSPPGRWEQRQAKSWEEDGKTHESVKSVWVCDDRKVAVTQFVEVVRGEQSNRLDTCRVRYQIYNHGDMEQRVGIRFLLDTFIGGNDGVPFTVPGESDLCDTRKDLPSQAKDKKVPDFLQALEKPDLAHPGTIAHLRLRVELPGRKQPLEPPARVTLGAWPNEKLRIQDRKAAGPRTQWDVPVLPLKALRLNDSAIVIYWREQSLKPGVLAAREVGFEYGLWDLARQGSGLAATVDGSFRPGGELTVVAYVRRTGEDTDETLTLDLPAGFSLIAGKESQAIPKLARGAAGANLPVTWKVRAGSTGKHAFTVRSSAGLSQSIPVQIKGAIFD